MNQISSLAARLEPYQRQKLALRILSKQESIGGHSYSERQELMNFIILEIKSREKASYQGINAFKKALSNQGSDLLAFAQIIDHKLGEIAQGFNSSLDWVRSVALLTQQEQSTTVYWQEWNRLYHLLPNKLHLLIKVVDEAMRTTPRTSSLVENLNSRLRNYFFLRKNWGLAILTYFASF